MILLISFLLLTLFCIFLGVYNTEPLFKNVEGNARGVIDIYKSSNIFAFQNLFQYFLIVLLLCLGLIVISYSKKKIWIALAGTTWIAMFSYVLGNSLIIIKSVTKFLEDSSEYSFDFAVKGWIPVIAFCVVFLYALVILGIKLIRKEKH